MAFSLAGAAALAGFASAQQPVQRPAPITYDVRVQPWSKTPSITTPSPFTPPADAGFMPPAPPVRPTSPPIDVSRQSSPPIDVSRPVSSSRTLYYRKDSNGPVKPSATAELTRPVAAAETQQPMAGGQGESTRPQSDVLGTSKSDKLIPVPEKLFRLDAETDFQKYVNNERAQIKADPTVKAEDKKNLDPIDFPPHLLVPGGEGPYPGRSFAERIECIEPNYVLYRRLLFEDVNSERYGWTLGPLQPFASAYQFYAGVQALPYKYFQFPCMRHDTSAGRCLPGDPVPSMIYPPGLSVTGALAQAGVTVAMYFIIP